MSSKSISLGIVDYICNPGGGRNYTSSLVRGLLEAEKNLNLKLITSFEAKRNRWFQEFDGSRFSSKAIITENTIRTILPPGRIAKLPGTWQLKSMLQRVLLNTIYKLQPQISKALADVDVAFACWPDFYNPIDIPIPMVVTVHDILYKYFLDSTSDQFRLLDRNIPKVLSQCASVITLTGFMKGEIQRFYPGAAKNIKVIYSPAPLLPPPLQGDARNLFIKSLGIKRQFVLYPAGLWPHKNHIRLIDALKELKNKGLDFCLVCTGAQTENAFIQSQKIPDGSQYVYQVRDHFLHSGLIAGEDIIGLGYVSRVELSTLYCESAGVVIPPIYEGGSLPLLEAVSAGVPVCCSDIPVYTDVLDYYGIKINCFDPLSSLSIAEGIEAILRYPTEKSILVENMQNVKARNWSVAAKEYLQVIRSVI